MIFSYILSLPGLTFAREDSRELVQPGTAVAAAADANVDVYVRVRTWWQGEGNVMWYIIYTRRRSLTNCSIQSALRWGWRTRTVMGWKCFSPVAKNVRIAHLNNFSSKLLKLSGRNAGNQVAGIPQTWDPSSFWGDDAVQQQPLDNIN